MKQSMNAHHMLFIYVFLPNQIPNIEISNYEKMEKKRLLYI